MSVTIPAPRRHETPNAVMHTYASRGLTGTDLAVWSVEMPAGAAGPVHAVDGEQVMVVLDGVLDVVIEGAPATVRAGGAVVLPAGSGRQVLNRGGTPVRALVAGRSGARVTTGDRAGAGVVLPWAE